MSNIEWMAFRYEKRIDLRQLRYFVAVAEELHFGRAAERLGMAQPPLTQQIQKLEHALGCLVFERQPRKTRLTAAGEALLEPARRLLEDFELAIDETQRIGRGEAGKLTVGIPPSVMLTRLPSVIRKYRKLFPRVEFALREMATSAIKAALEAEQLDLGFLRAASGRFVEFEFSEAVVAVLPASHFLSKRKKIAVQQLAKEPFVFFPRRLGEGFHDQLLSYCQAAGFTPRIVQEATQWQSVIALVEAGMGVSLAPACVEELGRSGVAYRCLTGLTTKVAVCSRGPATSPASEAFLRMAYAELVAAPREESAQESRRVPVPAMRPAK